MHGISTGNLKTRTLQNSQIITITHTSDFENISLVYILKIFPWCPF